MNRMDSTDIQNIINKLKRGRETERCLAQYGQYMSASAATLSAVRFSMNYLTFCETCADAAAEGSPLPAVILGIGKDVSRYVTEQLLENTAVFESETETAAENSGGVGQIAAIKAHSTRMMQQLTFLADRFCIYEYVLNRREYMYRDGGLPEGYTDAHFTNRLLQFILGKGEAQPEEDGQSMQLLRTVSVIEQLPLRMTRQKFYQLLHDGLSAYAASEQRTLDDLLDMLRTSAMISDISESEALFPFIYECLARLEEDGMEISGPERFEALWKLLQDGFEELNGAISAMMLLQELINDLYVIAEALAGGTAPDRGDWEIVSDIVAHTQAVFAFGNTKTAGETEAAMETLYGKYTALEGRQEAWYERYALCESVFEEFCSAYQEEIAANGCTALFVSLGKITRLCSGSLYAELEQTGGEPKLCDEAYIEARCRQLTAELDTQFKKLPKALRRAVMAKLLTLLPPFLRSYDQLEQYISVSLTGCEDIYEKTACIEILEEMMRDE